MPYAACKSQRAVTKSDKWKNRGMETAETVSNDGDSEKNFIITLDAMHIYMKCI